MSIVAATIDDSQAIADIIAFSNKDVAVMFGITQNNNPKHPSFYNKESVLTDFARGEAYFLYALDGKNIGCVAFEKPNDKTGYLNRLSVLPSYRGQGIGETLTKHVVQYGRSKDVSELSIGIIAKHSHLKSWYLKLGFIENGLKEFPHLPFDVLFMKYVLKNG